jgi:hypothetical protein
MRIYNVVEYKKALEELEILEAEWNSYYIDFERGNIDFYEYNLIMNELETKMNILEYAISAWENQ